VVSEHPSRRFIQTSEHRTPDHTALTIDEVRGHHHGKSRTLPQEVETCQRQEQIRFAIFVASVLEPTATPEEILPPHLATTFYGGSPEFDTAGHGQNVEIFF
jgi:hypothetical protein